MRKFSGTWNLIVWLLFCMICGLNAQNASFKEYVHEGYPPIQKEDFISFDVKDKDLSEVLTAISRKVGVNIVADPQVNEKVTITLDRVEWRNALELIAQQTNCHIVQVSDRLICFKQPPSISMEFQDADLKIVIDLLAKQSGANIIIAPDVQGKVSLSLREVPWENALETIVETAGYVTVKDTLATSGNSIIRVVRQESLTKQLESCWIQLRYVRPDTEYNAIMTDVQSVARSPHITTDGKSAGNGESGEFTLMTALKQLLSEFGSIQYDPKTNSLYVKDIKTKINEIKEIVSKIDREPAQIHVKAKFIVTSNVDLLETGIKFIDPTSGDRIGATVSAYGRSGSFTAGDSDTLYWGATFPFDVGKLGNPVKNFHALGILDFTQTELMMKYLKDDDASQVVQAPEITTIDGKSATIFVGENIPFAEQEVTIDQNGNATASLKENERSPVNVGFTLYLHPNVIHGTDTINMSIIPKINTLTGKSSSLDGFDRFTFGSSYIDLPRESTQIIVSHIRIKHGHTALLGGLQTSRKIEVNSRVPLLSSIPVLGNIFTYKRKKTTLENVMIMVTPTIIENTDMAEQIAKTAMENVKKTDFFFQKEAEKEKQK